MVSQLRIPTPLWIEKLYPLVLTGLDVAAIRLYSADMSQTRLRTDGREARDIDVPMTNHCTILQRKSASVSVGGGCRR